MPGLEIILRVAGLALLSAYLWKQHRRRQEAIRGSYSKWNGEVFDTLPLRPRMEEVRKTYRTPSRHRVSEGSRRRNWLKLAAQSVSRFHYFKNLRKNSPSVPV